CQQMQGVLASIRDDDDSDVIRWFETHRQSFRLNRTPLDISGMFQAQMERHPGSWVFTSATLAVGEKFEHFQHQLGLSSATTARWDSPFDYPNQALWFVPKGLPDPRSGDGYTDAVAEIARQVVTASRGRAFLLFTSYRALHKAAELLESALDYPLLVQGSAPKAKLLDEFRALGNAVLLGTASFWEGVDVRGEALSCVVIDKLPFSSPGDPVLQARIDALRKRGGNPFMEFQVPQAVIALKQGAGRLIRDVTDRGVLVICDPRLLKRGYGHVFLDSMPPMARTRDIADVQRFFDDEIADTA
ncbi:MAG: ATP-dependent DNA helicase, partial [Sedimenticola sp.]